MSTIASVLNNNATADTSTKSGQDMKDLMGTRDDFLKILLAQLKHQDPLEPMKGTEFIDSITRLSTVEQAVNQNTHLENIEKLLTGNGAAQFGSPVSYLDKTIQFTTDKITLDQGVSTFSYNLTTIPKQVFITITNDEGKPVFTSTAGENSANSAGKLRLGENNVSWDGTDNSGNPLKAGNYNISVNYVQESGAVVDIPVTTTGVVTGASFAGDTVSLNVGNLTTTLDKIISIKSTSQASQ
ncbi:MAG: flagellar hook capping protein [Rickettsiaceae bacterium]|jgi:flagellar basal-body rod modification protein FlgD|nr:flagellar hook capping protein [Rickettsiaceae bacterium]